MIKIRLNGGLGNQMFQYAFAKAFAHQNSVKFQIDKRFLEDRFPRKNFVFRNYELDIFDINISFYNPRKLYKFEVYFDLFARKFDKIIGNKSVYYEKKFDYNEDIFSLNSNTYFVGYFQSYHYFENIKEEIKKDFKLKAPISSNCLAPLSEIQNCNSICLHLRRGDFLTNAQHNVLSENYYEDAIKKLSSLTKDFKIFVFSDDIEWCQNNLTFDFPYQFVGKEYMGGKFTDYLELMRNCKHYIIPNSTFAWWAAYLSESKNKVVITPKFWLKNNPLNDIIPDGWVRV